MVRKDQMRLLLGTDAASEGLNLQRLGTLINFDIPWNPSRLEQREGRIQRIGQIRDTVDICNLRYAGSVEDRVRQLLSSRLPDISTLFGQLPDILEDVWVDVALGQVERAKRTIDTVPRGHHRPRLNHHLLELFNVRIPAVILDNLHCAGMSKTVCCRVVDRKDEVLLVLVILEIQYFQPPCAQLLPIDVP